MSGRAASKPVSDVLGGWSGTALPLAAEHAVDAGARVLLNGRARIGALIEKGERDFATDAGPQIERAVRSSLAQSAPDIAFLGQASVQRLRLTGRE